MFETFQEPIIIINCKTYGKVTESLAKKIAESSQKIIQKRTAENKKKINIIIAVPATEIGSIASLGLIPVIAEHVDPEEPGAHTGRITAEDIRYHGAIGSLINHSEDPTTMERIKKTIIRLAKNHLLSFVCVKDSKTAGEVAKLTPDFIAVEPPELIGTNNSISNSKPELITKSIEEIQKTGQIPLLVGAGIKNKEDVKKAVELGARGILVASGVTKAKNIEKAIEELASGFD